MTSLRFARISALIATLSASAACGGVVAGAEPAPPDNATPEPTPERPAVEPPRDAAPSPPPAPAPVVVEDSNTLRVDIGLDVTSWGDIPTDTAVYVGVRDAVTGAFIRDAEVSAGPIGHPIPLPLVETLYSAQPSYSDGVIGYDSTWELSVVRGRDYLKHVVLRGPSYPKLAVSRSAGAYVIDWSPAHEAGATTSVCAWGTPNRADLAAESVCSGPSDDGRAVIVPPPYPSTWVTFDKSAEVPVGSRGGTAVFRMHIDVPTP